MSATRGPTSFRPPWQPNVASSAEWYEQSFDPWTGEVSEVRRTVEDRPLSTKKCGACGLDVIMAASPYGGTPKSPEIIGLDPTPTPEGVFMVMVKGSTKSVRRVRDEERTPAMRFYNPHRCSGFNRKAT